MTPKEYVDSVLQTESSDPSEIKSRLVDGTKFRLLHAILGIATESGELMDVLKKYFFYGKEIDRTNLIEELGDLCWYIAVACDVLNIGLEDIWKTNIEKLRARYGDKFSSQKATNRDLDKERDILESSGSK